MASLEVSEKDWLKAMEQIAPVGSSKTAWVAFRSEIVSLHAKEYQLAVDEQAIQFHLPKLGLVDSPQIEMRVALPPAEHAVYEMRAMTEQGDLRLKLKYYRQRFPGRREVVQMIVATQSGFLFLPDSESQIQ